MIEKLLKLAAQNEPEIVNTLQNISKEVLNGPFANDFKVEQQQIIEQAENNIPKVARKLNMSLNELDEYLNFELNKNAASMGIGSHIGRALGDVGLSAIGSIGRLALNDLYHSGKEALTEKKYYNEMMKQNPDLHDYPEDRVKSLFKTLHRLGGTQLSSDANVAGTFVRGNAIYGDKGIDLKGVNDLISSRHNLMRSRDVIEGPQGTPGLGLLQRMQDEERNRDTKDNNDKRYKLDYDQFSHRSALDELDSGFKTDEAKYKANEESRRSERHAIELAQQKRDEARREREHRLNMHHGGLDTQVKNLDIKYKYRKDGRK